MAHTKRVVLVVEDESLLRLYATEVLEDAGYAVVEVDNAEAALEALETRDDVRLLFTDIQMPGALDGLELARRVHERWPQVRIVLASGRSRPRRAEMPDEARFIAKPFSPDELVGHIQDLLRD
jgi:CheY-like chemotaxis protein